MNEKITGYCLLGMGIVVMIFALTQVYLVFTNKLAPPLLFHANALSIDTAKLLGGQIPQTQQTPQQGGLEILSAADLNKTLNMSVHFFLMTFVLGFGFKIASLGVMLLRPVNVKMREEKPQVSLPQSIQPTSQKK